MSGRRLHHLLEESASRFGERTAVVDPGATSLTFAELNAKADEIRAALEKAGVRPGDRVGVCAHKSVYTVASIYGILKSGGAYVPVDPTAPMARIAYILQNCGVRAIVVHSNLVEAMREAMPEVSLSVQATLDGGLLIVSGPGKEEPVATSESPLAYILYTSGSTGKPKGVMITHGVALGFVDWGSETFTPTEQDVFSNHSPFHFDLSIFDLYVSAKHGAPVVLIGDELGKQPLAMADLIAAQGITIWYSTPAILRLILEFGKLERYSYPKLEKVLFAGEVFPTKHLRELKKIWSAQKFFNLYGPTETNVCTYYAIPDIIPEDRTEPYPIGWACSHCPTLVLDADRNPVPAGQEGELYVAGSAVMQGYWNLPEQNAKVFYTDANGVRWYGTGDVVIDENGVYLFRGRRDRMVKRRSYRVELGEIESALYRHPMISEAAVVATPNEESGVLITAFMSCTGEKRPGLIEMKNFCMQNLPKYMIPDRFSWQIALPKTSTDKVDYQKLKELA
jgi:amino acid adenylation domain-containing protein